MACRLAFTAVALAAGLAACTPQPTAEVEKIDIAAVEKAAHDGYVDAINSNDPEKFADAITDDVVYQYPDAPELVGKEAVMEWVRGYFAAYTTRWEKTSIGFTVAGDLAFERYTYKSTDTDRKSGAVTTGSGKGINIFRRGADGKWRVAVDGWSSDKPAS